MGGEPWLPTLAGAQPAHPVRPQRRCFRWRWLLRSSWFGILSAAGGRAPRFITLGARTLASYFYEKLTVAKDWRCGGGGRPLTKRRFSGTNVAWPATDACPTHAHRNASCAGLPALRIHPGHGAAATGNRRRPIGLHHQLRLLRPGDRQRLPPLRKAVNRVNRPYENRGKWAE